MYGSTSSTEGILLEARERTKGNGRYHKRNASDDEIQLLRSHLHTGSRT